MFNTKPSFKVKDGIYKFKDWSNIEKKMMEGQYIHPMSEVFGNYSDILRNFCKFIPELEFDLLDD